MDHKVIGWKGVGLIYLAPLGVETSDGPLWSRFPKSAWNFCGEI
jgi:hypothetical protein